MRMGIKITVIGCGRWGTFIAWYLDRTVDGAVTLYGREGSQNMERLQRSRSNGQVALPESVRLVTDFEAAADADIVIISIGSQGLRGLMEQWAQTENSFCCKAVVLCMKGLEIETGKRLSQIAEEYLPCPVAVWLGPGHVQEFYRGIPNCMVIDSREDELKRRLVKAFSSDLIRFYYGADLLGNEIGAAAKNVVGIAAGMLDGLKLSSLKGALMSRGTREISRLIRAMGGDELSAYGLCHLGDYEATVFSRYSHNRQYGESFVRGEEYSQLAEGVHTVRALMRLAGEYGEELPICAAVYRVLFEKEAPADVLGSLFLRSLKDEF